MAFTAHTDTFARDRLPPPGQCPERLRELPSLQFPERINCAVELLDRAVAERGWETRTALISPQGTLSYAGLQAQVDRYAWQLTEDMGAVPGNRVLLRGRNSPTLVALWLAVQKAGCIAVTTLPQLRARELTTIIDKAQVSHAFCENALIEELEAARSNCPALRQVIGYADDGSLAASGKNSALPVRRASPANHSDAVATAADDIALIAFTSGTTGLPKGTMHSHRDILSACACFPPHILDIGPDGAGEIFCGPSPLAFTYGLGGLLLFPLALGATALLLPKATPESLLAAVAQHRATTLFATPTFYRQMLPLLGRYDCSSLRRCISAGEPLSAAIWHLWHDATGLRLIDGIGSTEMLHIFISARAADMQPGAIGTPVPGYRAAILDDAGAPLPPGQVGRLAVKGPTGCRYLDDSRQADYVQDGWNITGDTCWQDAAGYYHFVARSDDLIISAGCNIAGPEVEEALLAHPAVAECGVVGRRDAERGQIVVACVVLRPGYGASEPLAEALQSHVKSLLAPFKVPRRIEFRETLPRTATGKLQRYHLRNCPA